MNSLQKLKDALRDAIELSQNRNLQPEDLEKIKQLWSELPAWDPKDTQQGSMHELIIDLQILNTTGEHLGKFIKNLQATSNPFSPVEYATKLKDQVNDWTEFANSCIRIINRAPGISPLLNTFSTRENEVTVTQQQKRRNIVNRTKDVVVDRQCPDKVNHIEATDETVDTKVRRIVQLLNSYKEPIPFYQLVLHPEFAKTVENIFYLSFVIRDGLATLDIIDDEFVIYPTKELPRNLSQGQKRQMVFSIDQEDWKKLIQDYNIQKPEIP